MLTAHFQIDHVKAVCNGGADDDLRNLQGAATAPTIMIGGDVKLLTEHPLVNFSPQPLRPAPMASNEHLKDAPDDQDARGEGGVLTAGQEVWMLASQGAQMLWPEAALALATPKIRRDDVVVPGVFVRYKEDSKSSVTCWINVTGTGGRYVHPSRVFPSQAMALARSRLGERPLSRFVDFQLKCLATAVFEDTQVPEHFSERWVRFRLPGDARLYVVPLLHPEAALFAAELVQCCGRKRAPTYYAEGRLLPPALMDFAVAIVEQCARQSQEAMLVAWAKGLGTLRDGQSALSVLHRQEN